MVPDSILNYLQAHGSEHQVIEHAPTATLTQAAAAVGISPRALLRAVVLVDGKGLLMALLPADHMLDFNALSEQCGRDLEPLSTGQLGELFDDCEAGCCPPLGPAYGLATLVDERVYQQPVLWFEPGVRGSLVRLSADTLRSLLPMAQAGDFARPVDSLKRAGTVELDLALEHFTPARLKQSIEEFHDLPPLPRSAASLLRVANDANAGAKELAQVIEQDPLLAAKLLRYANSPLYGQAGKIDSIQVAIARVLGFDFVLNLALGVTIGTSLRIPNEGPLGLEAFWKHSVYCASLSERLGQLLPNELRPPSGRSYVCGLLHNLGFLVLGHTFQSEFYLLNRYLAANPDAPVEDVEKLALGTNHTQIGGWLMQAWGMPEHLTRVVTHHHDLNYSGEHAEYIHITLLANRALRAYGLGHEASKELPGASLGLLKLTQEEVWTEAERLMGEQQELDELARLVA